MSSTDCDDLRFVLSVDNNDLILYTKIDADNHKKKYTCTDCIKKGTKRTKRLIFALKTQASLTIKINIDCVNKIILSINHPLYDDDDIYILRDAYSILEQEIKKEKKQQNEKPLDNIEDIDTNNKQPLDNIEDVNTNKQPIDNIEDINTNKQPIDNIEDINTDKQPIDNIEDINTNKQPLCYIYILELKEDKFYVGKSSKPLARTGEHMVSSMHNDASCSGSGWTSMYTPIKILRVIVSYDEFDEDFYTFKYMKQYGIDNVRGGSFCELNLSYENVTTLGKMLAGAGDKCYFCGGGDHYIASCPQKKFKRKTKKKKRVIIKNVPKTRILKYLGTSTLMQNSDIIIEDANKNINQNDNGENKKNKHNFRCRFCEKQIETQEKLKIHESIMCKKSSIVQQGKNIEASVDAILKAHDKYLNSKDTKKSNI